MPRARVMDRTVCRCTGVDGQMRSGSTTILECNLRPSTSRRSVARRSPSSTRAEGLVESAGAIRWPCLPVRRRDSESRLSCEQLGLLTPPGTKVVRSPEHQLSARLCTTKAPLTAEQRLMDPTERPRSCAITGRGPAPWSTACAGCGRPETPAFRNVAPAGRIRCGVAHLLRERGTGLCLPDAEELPRLLGKSKAFREPPMPGIGWITDSAEPRPGSKEGLPCKQTAVDATRQRSFAAVS